MLTHTLVRLAADVRYDGEDPGPGLTGLQVVLLFVGIPLAVALIVGLLVFAPSWTRSGRSTGGAGWFAQPVWFHGPGAGRVPSPTAALTSTSSTTTVGGGARARW